MKKVSVCQFKRYKDIQMLFQNTIFDMRKLIYAALLSLLLINCGSNGQKTDAKGEGEVELLPLPEVPSELTSPEDRATFVVAHFWDKMDFKDTVKSHNDDFMQQNFVNFLGLMVYVPDSLALDNSFTTMIEKAKADSGSLAIIKDLAVKYLDDPNSPMRSEDLFIIYLNSMLKQNDLPVADREKLEYRLSQAMKNRVGTKAADFAFRKKNGGKTTLYKSLPSSENLLLIFFDPECEHCDEILTTLMKDRDLNLGIEAGEIKVLAVYIGNKEDVWGEKIKTFPTTWEVGIDDGLIDETDLYYLPAMPTIYMLDSDGIVLGKDIQI